jgi:HlyD family secretion protein
MRMPRVRFTIRRPMVAVLVSGLALGGAVFLWPVFDQLAIERRALAAYNQARLARNAAESAVQWYEKVTYPQDKTTYQGQIALASSDLERAIDRLKWSTEMKKKGLVSVSTNVADQLTKQKAEFDLEQAKTQYDVLEKYAKDKERKTLRSNLEKARSVEQAKQAAYQAERVKRLRMLGF